MIEFLKDLLETHIIEKREVEDQKCIEIASVYTNISNMLNKLLNTKEPVDPINYIPTYERAFALLLKENSIDIKPLHRSKKFQYLQQTRNLANELCQNFMDHMQNHNDSLWAQRIPAARNLIGNVGGYPLDQQQMLSVVKNAHNQLVLAGAGTGKSTSIIGKVKYVLAKKQLTPTDILILSFTNASAAEMQEKISKEIGQSIDVFTFHKLGLNILTAAYGKKPTITHLQMHNFLKDNIIEMMKTNDSYRKKVWAYVLNNGNIQQSEFDFSNQEEYDEYLKLNPPKTVKGEVVKSYGEMLIANFLYQNNINYEYEKQYEFDTSDGEHGQYYPDFYLTDYNLWIEYFGVDRKGNVPSYWDCSSEDYLQSMRWKEQCHQVNKTSLMACYAFQHLEGILIDHLIKQFQIRGIPLKPMTHDSLVNNIHEEQNAMFDNLITMSETVINLLKSNRYTIDRLKEMNIKTGRCQRHNRLLIDLIEPLYERYQNQLIKNNEIDFNDMINKAIDAIVSKQYYHNYSLVIVDEYQDISKARFELLYAMRRQKDYNLFCVGDDWQSIYRFAGSDVGFILKFDKYWGPTDISKIETTYRFSQSLIDVSGSFVMNNPSQIVKHIHGANTPGFAVGEINAYTDKYAMEFTAKRLDELPKNSTVYFIGRYSFDVKLLEEGQIFENKYNNATGIIDVLYNNRPDLKMQFITAHKSKGLQADYVFIINNKNGPLGFPSQIQDDSILKLLLENCDDFPFAEERRLYYVALTRAKIKTFIVTILNQESSFVGEIKQKYGKDLKREYFECPWCGVPLERKQGPYGEFYGCSNYHKTGCRFTRKIKK